MSYPAGWDLVTVTGTYVARDGAPCTGSVEFSSPQIVLRSGTVVPAADISFTLDSTGKFTGQVPATDDPNATPINWLYIVTEHVPGGRSGLMISVPHTSAGIDMSTVVPVTQPVPSSPPYPLITLQQLAAASAPDGASLVGFDDPVAPAYLKTTSDILSGVPVNALRNLPKSEWAGIASGTSTYDCSAGINELLAAVYNSGSTSAIQLPRGRIGVAHPIIMNSGNYLYGDGQLRPDVSGGSAQVYLLDGSNCSMLETAAGVSGNIADANTYFGLRGVAFVGNSANQTVESIGIKWWGTYITSFVRDVFIHDVFGPAFDASAGADFEIDNIWVNICYTNNYPFSINNVTNTINTPIPSGLTRIGRLYVENCALAANKGIDAITMRATPSIRAQGILINALNRITINEVHGECLQDVLVLSGTSRGIDIAHVHGAHIGNGTNGSILRITGTAPPSGLRVGLIGVENPTDVVQPVQAVRSDFNTQFPSKNFVLNSGGFGTIVGYESTTIAAAGYGFKAVGDTFQGGQSTASPRRVTADGAITATDMLVESFSTTAVSLALPDISVAGSTVADGRKLVVLNSGTGTTTVFVSATMTLTGVSGAFAVGDTVTGGTSGKTATVASVSGASLLIRSLTGAFTVGETITGTPSGATATLAAVTALGNISNSATLTKSAAVAPGTMMTFFGVGAANRWFRVP